MAQAARSVQEARSLPKVGSRKEFVDALYDMDHPPKGQKPGHDPSGRLAGLRTYMLERNGPFGPRQGKKSPWEMGSTGVDDIKTLAIRPRRGGGRLQFYMDMADRRYLLFHTGEPAEDANAAMEALVEDGAHRLDHAWFHSGLLERWAARVDVEPGGPVAGHGGPGRGAMPRAGDGRTGAARRRGPVADPNGGGAAPRGSRRRPGARAGKRMPGTGCFSVRRGQSMQDHLHTVEDCRDEYASIVARAERRRMGLALRGGTRTYVGGPIEIMYPKVARLGRFVDSMFRATGPFHLWGIKMKQEADYYSVPALDFHWSSPIDFEITPTFMRVYTRRKSCGNTILRIFANLQARHCAGARCELLER